MHYGIEVVTLGDYADPRNVLTLAVAAEKAGWDGLFIWDHLGYVWGAPAADPWVTLSAVAAHTSRLKLCAAVTPLPRRRPQVLAQTLASLDLLSQGRVIFAAGLGGVPEEFTCFGEPGEAKTRAAMLDEGLDIINRFFAGETVSHRGRYYTVENISFSPLPVQRPRIPVWIGGESHAALRRAAAWDGWTNVSMDERGKMIRDPRQLEGEAAYIRSYRTNSAPFDVAITGYTRPGKDRLPREYEQAGATWWAESLHGYRGSPEEMMQRVLAGPPN